MSPPPAYITRFAPSPTGYLHTGHGFSALTAFGAAKAHRGQCLLRIEDIDHTRCRPQYEAAIYEDLEWLGCEWPTPVLRQSERLGAYQAALDQLTEMGVLYACYKTRKELMLEAMSAPQASETPPNFRGEPADLGGGGLTPATPRPPAWRLSLKAARDVLGARYDTLSFVDDHLGAIKADPAINGDVVLSRKDIGFAYHLAVVVDDAFQGVTHIHRGLDLLEATHTQLLLQALLDLPTLTYAHHRLILDENGQRLAKRKGSKALRDYRLESMSLEALKTRLGLGA